MSYIGIDICEDQGKIDFQKVKASGITYVIPRDGWGTSKIDPMFLEYVQNAQKAGLVVPGVFHFIYATTQQQAVQNAMKAIEHVQKAGLPKTTIIWCDLEYDTVKRAKQSGI